jgi:uncharacterized phage protein gp47/JayE
MAGVISTGFQVKTLAECKADLEAAFRAAFGTDINLTPPSVWATIIGIVAERDALLWEQLEMVYGVFNPDAASGVALDNLCAISGTYRQGAKRTTVTCDLRGTSGTLVPAGSVVKGAAGVLFRSTMDATLLGVGIYMYVPFESIDPGPYVSTAGTLTTIVTPVSGWTSVTNPTDASPGRAQEIDPLLRTRRVMELRSEGNASIDAITSKVMQITGVTSCMVFENSLDSTSGGMAGHSIEVVVYTPTQTSALDQAIADAIWASKAGGVQTVGGISGDTDVSKTVIDSLGYPHTIHFSRPQVQTIYIIANIKTDSAWDAVNGATNLKNAIAAWGLAHVVLGTDLVTRSMLPTCFGVSGVHDVTNLYVGTAASPSSEANVTATTRQLSVIDTSRITVNASAWTET